MKNAKILFRSSSLSEKDELSDASKHFEILKSRMEIKPNDFIIPRYSIAPFVKEFFDDLNYINASSINSYEQYYYTADLKNYIVDLKDLTFKTWRASEGISNLPDNCSFILKGETNGRKFEWNSMMFAQDKSCVSEIYGNLLKDSLIADQEVYIREFVPLKTFKVSFKGLPITNEYRFFIAYGEVISSGYYWSNYYDDFVAEGINLDAKQVPKDFINEVISKVGNNCCAYVVDIAETAAGNWVVVELNAFETSGLSKNDSLTLYSNLKKVIDKNQ